MPDFPIRRVLMTGDTIGGVWTFALELAESLGAHGVEVILAAMGGEASRDQQAAASSIRNLRLFTRHYKLEWMDNPWADVEASGEWLLELERQFAPDVIHLNTYCHASIPFQAPRLLTAHSCVLSWWAAVKGSPLPDTWRRYRDEVSTSLRSVHSLVTPSHAMRRMLRENYDVDLPACRVVPNGRNHSRFKAASKKQFVLTAGRLWDEAKNVNAVIQAAAGLPWPVYLAGDYRHPNGDPVKAPGCFLLGRLPAEFLAEWYARAAIYALPARYEPFGLSAVEAALSGCALVLGDIESLREIWHDAALFVPPDDTPQLSSVLRGLIADDAQREDLARRGMKRALTFSPQRMAAGYMEAYTELAGSWRVACAS